jgi:hypothetical protein
MGPPSHMLANHRILHVNSNIAYEGTVETRGNDFSICLFIIDMPYIQTGDLIEWGLKTGPPYPTPLPDDFVWDVIGYVLGPLNALDYGCWEFMASR